MSGEDLYRAWTRARGLQGPSLSWRDLSPHTQTEWRLLAEQVNDLGGRLVVV